MFRDYARKVYLNRNKPKRTAKVDKKKTFYMVREVLVQGIRKPITQRIPIQAESYEEALRIASILNSQENLNPRATIINWYIE